MGSASKPKNMTSGSGTMGGISKEIVSSKSGKTAGWLSSLNNPLGKRSQNVLHALKLSLVGMIGGGLYGLLEAEAKDHGILTKCPDNTTAFDLDPVAGVLFLRLGKYRYLNEEAYKRAVNYCDLIFMKEKELASSRRPTDADMSIVEAWILAVLGCIILMRQKAYLDGKTQSEVHELKKSINEMLKQHRKTVFALTASTRVN